MKTGDIILISSKTKQAEIIQEFQSLEDKESGKYNHSGLVYVTPFDTYVIEASYVQQRKIKAAIVITPLEHYLSGDYEILLLQHLYSNLERSLEKEMFKYVGTPYEYVNLTIEQIVLKLTNIWIGRNKKADKRFICHEFTMTIWNNLLYLFPECRKGQVKNIYYSKNFKHNKIK